MIKLTFTATIKYKTQYKNAFKFVVLVIQVTGKLCKVFLNYKLLNKAS